LTLRPVDQQKRAPERAPRDDDDDEADRTTTNIVLVIGAVILIGGGLWLANAMLEARRADECISSGRRNCNPVTVTPQPLR
jgi:hypothetical protein